MRSPKKPKAPRLPKKPKASANSATLKRYLDRVADVKKAYVGKLSDWKKKVNAVEKEKRDKKTLRDRVAKITSASIAVKG